MRPLSSAYHRDVIMDVIAAGNPDDLKNLVLSSREMCNSFGIFMQTAKVVYCRGYRCGRLFLSAEDSETCPINTDRYYWIVNFVRNLELRVGIFRTEFPFFEQIYKCNNLSRFELLCRVSLSTEVVRKLISITRRLIIWDSKLSQIEDFLPRFEAVYITAAKSTPKSREFMEHVNTKSMNVLELTFESFPFDGELGFLQPFKEKFHHVSTLCFVWPFYDRQVFDGKGMVSRALSFFSNIKNFKFYVGNLDAAPADDANKELLDYLSNLPGLLTFEFFL